MDRAVMNDLLDRLKQRKLVQWALAYLAGAWVLLQLVDVLAEPLGLSMPVRQGLLVALIIGFVLTLVLAWYHGERGHQRVSGPELLMIALLLAVAGMVISRIGAPRADQATAPSLPATEDMLNDPLAIAVLPVRNMAGSEDDFLADGIQEDLISQLHLVGSFTKVISRTSTMRYRDTDLSISEIARELGVGTVVEASVRRAAGRILVAAQLVDAVNDNHLWSERYDDRSERDIFDIQADITRRIAEALQATVASSADEKLALKPTENWEAYQLYLQARRFFHERGGASLRRSLELYQGAIDEDPEYAEAYAGLAAAYAILPGYVGDMDYKATLVLADSLAVRAIALNPELGEPHAVRGLIFDARRMWTAAAEEHRIALVLAPHNSNTLVWSAIHDAAVGRFDTGMERLNRAYEVDPGHPAVNAWLARIHRLRGEHELQLLFAKQALDLGYGTNPWIICDALLQLRRLDEADSVCRDDWRSVIDGLRAADGRALAVESASQLRSGSGTQLRVWELLDEVDSLFSALEPWRTESEYEEVDAWFEHVWGVSGTSGRSHPRFRDLLRDLGIVDYWRESTWPEVCSRVGDEDFECR